MSFKLVTLHAYNYKNFLQFAINDLRNFNLFLGLNGVGKSNFLSIMSLLNVLLRNDVINYFNDHKQFSDYLYRWDKRCMIDILIVFYSATDDCYFKYSFRLSYDEEYMLRVTNEMFTNIATKKTIFYFSRSAKNYLLYGNNISSHAEDCEYLLYDFLFNIRIYSCGVMNNYFTNSVVAIFSLKQLYFIMLILQNNYPKKYAQMRALAQLYVAGFADFAYDHCQQQILFTIKGLPFNVSLDKLSTGSFRFLYLLIILNVPQELRGSFLVLDEPEVSLHPNVLSVIADLIDSYALETQVFLTTQSYYLIKKLNIENLYLVSTDIDNNAYVHFVDFRQSKWLERYSLSDAWLMNAWSDWNN